MPEGAFDGGEIAIPCPECGKEHLKTLGWIRDNRDIACSCGVTIHLEADQAMADLDQVNKALADAIGKFGSNR